MYRMAMTKFMKAVMKAVKKKSERVHKLCIKAKCDKQVMRRYARSLNG